MKSKTYLHYLNLILYHHLCVIIWKKTRFCIIFNNVNAMFIICLEYSSRVFVKHQSIRLMFYGITTKLVNTINYSFSLFLGMNAEQVFVTLPWVNLCWNYDHAKTSLRPYSMRWYTHCCLSQIETMIEMAMDLTSRHICTGSIKVQA